MNTENIYLIVQHTYDELQIALFKNKNCIEVKFLHKHKASGFLIPTIKSIMKKNKLLLSQLSFIRVNQGPGPFTTLRVIIASINALSFTLGIPLIGINGLEMLVKNHSNKKISRPVNNNLTFVALLNAFSEDVYFAIEQSNKKTLIGCQNIEFLLKDLVASNLNENFIFLGAGAIMHKDLIKKLLPKAQINDKAYSTFSEIAAAALKKWQERSSITRELKPIYLKNTVYGNVKIPDELTLSK